MRKNILSFLFFSFLFNYSSGQDLNNFLDAYRGQNVAGFVSPLIDLLGANLNTGRSEWAKLDSAFHICISVIGCASRSSNKMKVFTAAADESFTPTSFNSIPGK